MLFPSEQNKKARLMSRAFLFSEQSGSSPIDRG
jgi:hypothetical protein